MPDSAVTKHHDPVSRSDVDQAVFRGSEEMSACLEAVRQGRLLLNRLDQWLLDGVREHLGCRVVDVGCGHGNLMSLLLDCELVVGTDVDETSVQAVRERFRDRPHVHAHVFNATQPPRAELVDYEFDTVISLNALEHIERDDLAVRNMLKLLPTGGSVVIIVPAHMFLYGTMDASIGHYRRYTGAMMADLLTQAGATIRRQFRHNLIGALGWWFSGRVLRRKTPPTGQLSVFNRLVPMLAFAEERMRPPFGLSLVTVASVGE